MTADPGKPKAIWLADGGVCAEGMFEARYSRLGTASSKPNPSDMRTETEKDKDRIAYSGYLHRLSGVTQVVSPGVGRPFMHSRLTHTYKVALVSRGIAEDALGKARAKSEFADLLISLGGLDRAACEAAGLAHDLGHPPFGHVAEKLMDQWLLETDGETDGFEGNAQSTRIVSYLDRRKVRLQGLDLTRVSLAGLLKYPWTRGADGLRSKKYSLYNCDPGSGGLLAEKGKASTDLIASDGQSLEASVMDLADDITYAMHDLQDFYQANVIDMHEVHDDIEAALAYYQNGGPIPRSREELKGADRPGAPYDLLAVDMREKYEDYFNVDLFLAGLRSASSWIRTLGSRRFDHSQLATARLREAFSDRIGEYMAHIVISAEPLWADGPHLSLDRTQWHEMQILKFVARRYVVSTPKIGLHQRSQVAALRHFLDGTEEWVHSCENAEELPEPLKSYLTNLKLQDLPEKHRRRAVVDFACTLTDQECLDFSRAYTGTELPLIAT